MQQVPPPLANTAPITIPPNQNSGTAATKPQAKITGLNLEAESDGAGTKAVPVIALDSLELQPIEITRESANAGENAVLIEDEFANADLMDENFLSQNVSVAVEVTEPAEGTSGAAEDTQTEATVDDLVDSDTTAETDEEPTLTPVDMETDLDEASIPPRKESAEPALSETVGAMETPQPSAAATGEDTTDVSTDAEQLLGWKQIAGDTLLKQIRTLLAGVGFLVIVVQLARRRQ
jgi:hypothetical protein